MLAPLMKPLAFNTLRILADGDFHSGAALAREAHFPVAIAELYDPGNMPESLRHARERNDEVAECIYIGRRFKNDTERLEKLFELYTKMKVKDSKTTQSRMKA